MYQLTIVSDRCRSFDSKLIDSRQVLLRTGGCHSPIVPESCHQSRGLVGLIGALHGIAAVSFVLRL